MRDDLEAILEQCESKGMRAYLPMAHELASELAQHLEEFGDADSELRHAYRLYDEFGAAGHVRRLARRLRS